MTDTFSNFNESLDSPIAGGAAVTPHDTNDLTTVTRGIYLGASGDVKLITVDGDTLTFVGLSAGIIHPIRVSRVFSTGTTATSILGLY